MVFLLCSLKMISDGTQSNEINTTCDLRQKKVQDDHNDSSCLHRTLSLPVCYSVIYVRAFWLLLAFNLLIFFIGV